MPGSLLTATKVGPYINLKTAKELGLYDLSAEPPQGFAALVLTPNQGAHLVPLCEQEFGEVAADAAYSAGAASDGSRRKFGGLARAGRATKPEQVRRRVCQRVGDTVHDVRREDGLRGFRVSSQGAFQ